MRKNSFANIGVLTGLTIGFLRMGQIRAEVLHVPSEYSTIQAAIGAALEGDEVIVSPGIYRENIIFLNRNIILRSENPLDPEIVATTIIEPDPNSSRPNLIEFYYRSSLETVLSGFTIQNSSIGAIDGHGGDPTISYNVIQDNCSVLHAAVRHCGGLIYRNTIRRNTGSLGGGIHFCGGIISENIIEDNIVDYRNVCSGIGNPNSSVSGAGINNCFDLIEGNIIRNNSAIGGVGLNALGGGIANCTRATIINNLIVGNFATTAGGGLYNCNGDIINNTIVSNRSDGPGGGLYDCQGLIGNSIIWDNDVALISFPIYSVVPDEFYLRTTNIFTDPSFLNEELGDYQLSQDSPCIDSGAAILDIEKDLDGNPRPFESKSWSYLGDRSGYDMGAYEFQDVFPIPAVESIGWMIY